MRSPAMAEAVMTVAHVSDHHDQAMLWASLATMEHSELVAQCVNLAFIAAQLREHSVEDGDRYLAGLLGWAQAEDAQ